MTMIDDCLDEPFDPLQNAAGRELIFRHGGILMLGLPTFRFETAT